MNLRGPDVPDVVLERYRLNELPADARRSVEQRLRADAALRQRLADLDRSDEQIRSGGDIDRLARTLRQPRSSKAPMFWLLPLGAAAVVVLLLAVMPSTSPRSGDAAAERVEIKGGGPSLMLYRKTDGGSETLADGAVVRRGDLIRVGYRSAGRTFGAIVSVDGRGAVTMHLPVDGSRSAPLGRSGRKEGPGEIVLLDRAYELDDAPRWERFYFVTADREFGLEPVLEAIRHAGAQGAAAPLPLPRSLEQTVFSLQKGVEP